jgi:ketosteroid isomerase-like protein
MSTQPLSAQDRLDIIQVIANYSRLLDARDVEAWLRLWRPDAVLASMSDPATGHDELRAWVHRLFEQRKVGYDPAQLVHFIGLPAVDGDSDRATAQTYTIIFDYTEDGQIQVPLVGRYDDVFSRYDGQWRFERRHISGVLSSSSRGVAPAPAVTN